MFHKSAIRSRLQSFAIIFLTTHAVTGADPLPLSTSYWKDSAFLKSFNGSYRIEARIEPSVTTEQRGLLVEIQNLMAAGKRTDALEKLKSNSLTKDSPALTFNLGNLYFEAGEITEAIRSYKSALSGYPSFRRAHKNIALAYVRENKLTEALDHLVEAIRLGDSEGSTYGMLGYCRLDREEYASALQAYRLAQITEPEVPEWSAGIAQCLQQLGEQTEAIALLEETIRKRPLEASYSVLKSGIHLALGQDVAAIKSLELPHRLGLLDADQILLLADLQLRANLPDLAKTLTEDAFSKEEKPSSDSLVRLISTASTPPDWPFVKELLGRTDSQDQNRDLRLATANYLIGSKEDPGAGEEDTRGSHCRRSNRWNRPRCPRQTLFEGWTTDGRDPVGARYRRSFNRLRSVCRACPASCKVFPFQGGHHGCRCRHRYKSER